MFNLRYIETIDDRAALISLIDETESALFKKGQKMELDGEIGQVLSGNEINLENRFAVTEGLKKLREELDNLKTVRVTLSFEPSKEFVTKISNHLTDMGFSNFILDIMVDPKILGGAVLSYEGVHKDYSLLKEIPLWFEKNSSKVLEEFGIPNTVVVTSD